MGLSFLQIHNGAPKAVATASCFSSGSSSNHPVKCIALHSTVHTSEEEKGTLVSGQL